MVSGTPAASWSATTVSCTALNQHLCLQAQFEKQVEFLASPVTGGAVVVSRFEQLYLLCIKQGKKLPAEWAAQVWPLLGGQGERLFVEGKVLETADENLAGADPAGRGVC